MSNNVILLVGCEGQLGMTIQDAFIGSDACEDDDVILLAPHAKLDVTDKESVAKAFIENPDITAVINCAALHDATACEADPELAIKVNTAIPLVDACRKHDVLYVYVSTDCVFDNAELINKPAGMSHFDRECHGAASSSYGWSKTLGEMAAWYGAGGIVARVSTLFGKYLCRGKNNLNLIDRMFTEAYAGNEFTGSTNLVAITCASWAAEQLLRIAVGKYDCLHTIELENDKRSISHLVSSNTCSYYELAKYVYYLAGANTSLVKEGERKSSFPLLPDDPRAPTWQAMVGAYAKAKGWIK